MEDDARLRVPAVINPNFGTPRHDEPAGEDGRPAPQPGRQAVAAAEFRGGTGPWPAPPREAPPIPAPARPGRLAVRRIDGVFCVLPEQGEPMPIWLGQDRLESFHHGWSPVHVLSLFAPVFVLELLHVDGHRATWFLDQRMARIGGALRDLPPAAQATLQAQALPLFRAVMDRLVIPARPDHPARAADLALLGEPLIQELLQLVRPELLPRLRVVNLFDPAADAQLAELGLRGDLVRAALSGSFVDDYRARMRTGAMPGVSPFDGGPADAEAGLMLDRITAYRHVDPRCERSFYVATKDYHDTKTALYVPSLELYCMGSFPTDFETFFLRLVGHMTNHQHRLVPYLATPASARRTINFVSDYPTLHIGHVMWNEISGLEELVQLLPRDALPHVCVLNAVNGSEPYGQLDVLFPEFAGRVERPPIQWAQAAAFVYERGFFFVRYMTKYVRLGGGRRIRELVRQDPRLAEDRALAQRLADEGRLCILLGLRVGNRTIVDFTAYLIDVIEHLTRRLGAVTIVLDGSNARLGLDPSTAFGSFGPPGQEEPLVEELRIVFQLRRRFDGTTVRIVSAVGSPLAANLFWIMQSRFFVAPWGAALAKYRWVCNTPGFVVTNRNNLAHPEGDLLIYNAPRFMEEPTPMRFIDLADVVDEGAPGFYTNFRPAPAAVHAGIDSFIAETGLTTIPG